MRSVYVPRMNKFEHFVLLFGQIDDRVSGTRGWFSKILKLILEARDLLYWVLRIHPLTSRFEYQITVDDFHDHFTTCWWI